MYIRRARRSDAKVALAGFTWEAMKYYLRNGTSFPYVVLQILGQSGVDFDIFDYHFYEDYRKFKRIDGLIHSHLSADVAYDTKPTWVTETNVDKNQMNPYDTAEAYNRFVAKDIAKRYCTLLHNGVEKAFWFKLADDKRAVWNVPMEPDDFCRFRGLTASDFTPKPAYYTYKLLIEKTDGKERVKKEGLPTDSDIWIYRFGRNDKAVYILWHDSESGEPVGALIPLPWDEVLITHVITEPGITEPVTEIRLTVNGFLEITLDDSPVFVEKHQTTE